MSSSALQIIKEELGYVTVAELEEVVVQVVLLAGMTPIQSLTLPPAREGHSWVPCWVRGVAKLMALGPIDEEPDLG